MEQDHDTKWVPLATAAHRMKVNRFTAYDLALTGRIEAKQMPNGRWMVAESSLEETQPDDAA